MRAQPLPLIGGFYADDTRPWSMQDICNWLPVATESEGTRTATMAKTPPGLSPFAQVSLGDAVRGVYNAEGRLFTVIGNTAYQISNSGVAIPLGSISGVGRVRFAHNQITGGNEVLIVNGSAGWVWNTVTSTLTQITDTGYPGAINAAFIDGYLIQIEPARRYAFHSDLADALNYNTLDRFTSEVSPDLLVSMAVSNNELLLFSETTTEFFENTGATQQPFRSKRISFQKGCAGRYTVATMDNTVFWLGDDGVFYLLDGYSPRRISTRPIEQAIRGLNWAQAFAFVWEDSGHSVCYWTFPDGMTFGYDASQQKWHRRASYGFARWRVSDMTYWQNRWIAGDFQNGRLWELEWDYPLEGDEEFVSEITSPVIHDNQSRVLMPRLEVVMDTGMPEVEARTFPAQPTGPSITGEAPDGAEGEPYGPFSYATVAGDASIVGVSLMSGTLPPGITMDSVGTLSAGPPTAVGDYPITVRVTDANGLWDELDDEISITYGTTWFITAGTPNEAWAGEYSGDVWDARTVPSIIGLAFYFDGHVYIQNTAGATGLYSADKGVTYTAHNPVAASAGGGMMDTAGGYLFRCCGVNVISRCASPTGAWTQPTVDTASRADAIAVIGNTVILTYSGRLTASISTDYGFNWTAGGAFNTSSNNGVTRIVAAGSALYILYNDGVTNGYNLRIKRSTNEGATWSAALYTFPNPGVANAASALVADDVNIIAVSATGQIAYSPITDGATWTASVSTFAAVCRQLAVGDGKIMAACEGGLLYSSVDHGVTWQARTDPVGAKVISGIAWIYP